MKIHAKGFLVVGSLVALTFTPALFAEDNTTSPGVFERIWEAIVEIVVPGMDELGGEPPVETESGPHIVFIG